ncbi:TBCD protein [Coprinopsis cinerea AmutBmut pab1-1]|nr:TBCD protein [Coprinopsis cinerea AmutBmut pab1-1]
MADEDTYFTVFEGHAEFTATQDALLAVDLFKEPTMEEDREEYQLFKKLEMTFYGYHEQSYLLDPYLEQLVVPVVKRLRDHIKSCVLNPELKPSSSRVEFLCKLLYKYTNFRGYKTIVRFFPHEVSDLSVVLDYIRIRADFVDLPNQWALRYVVLLWLSIVCMIPFDLSQLDEPGSIGKVADTVEDLGKKYLDRAGLEKEGAALLLSRLYMRKDTASRFPAFVKWSTEVFQKQNEGFIMIGILQVIAEVAKSGPLALVRNEQEAILHLISKIEGIDSLKRNTLVRKYRSKLLSRVALRLLPHAAAAGRRKYGKTLEGGVLEYQHAQLDEADVPEVVEVILEQLFEAVQDKDTIVRWSASKGIARIAESLPTDFATQILETLFGLFSIHSVAAATTYDMPSVAEATWHGACLACAEMARRNIIPASHMPQLVDWLSKALYFDIRKGAHSIGSNVRDAAAYVLWALARTQDIPTLKPHANVLATHLASVAIYDREVHIRRAASAAYQEHVGRTSLFPHGIDVLSKTDFYSVSIRKHSFILAAPQVARHEEYRSPLLHHVLNVVLRHWDVSMRELGAQSLRQLCLINLKEMAREAIPKIIPLIQSLDPTEVHGGLLALTELGLAYRESIEGKDVRDSSLQKFLTYLDQVPESLIAAPRNHLVTQAACRLVATTLTKAQAEAAENLDAKNAPYWRKVIDIGIRHRVENVQDAAAEAVVIKDLGKGSPTALQSLAKILSAMDYVNNKDVFPKAVACVLEGVKPSPRTTIETRRAWYLAIPSICSSMLPNLIELLPAETMATFMEQFLIGLDDYTIDERGDVGSWIRIASVQGLTSVSELVIKNGGTVPQPESYLSPPLYLTVVASILKQGVERLDNVRQEVGKSIARLLQVSNTSDRLNLPELQLLRDLFSPDSEDRDWADAAWLFPRAIKLLDLPVYRQGVLDGAVNSIGSKTDSTQKEMSKALANYTKNLPLVADGGGYDLVSLLDDLLGRVFANSGSNKIVLPIFQTFNVLLDEECLEPLSEDERGRKRLQSLVTLTTKHAGKWKSVQRIHEAMKIFVKLMVFPSIQANNIHLIGEFLAHPFPKTRYETAEYFYLQVESADYGIDDTGEIEASLLETRWTTISQEEAKEAAEKIASVFKENHVN